MKQHAICYSGLSVFAVAVALLFTSVSFPSGQVRAEGVFEACGSEIKNHCADVRPGNGRLFACIYAHEDKLSDSCDAATADIGDILDRTFEVVRYTKQECRQDIRKHCSKVEMGEGGIYACLKSRSSDLSDACSGALGSISFPKN
jgi:hypothetical protein